MKNDNKCELNIKDNLRKILQMNLLLKKKEEPYFATMKNYIA